MTGVREGGCADLLDEFRPFRRGEIALARRLADGLTSCRARRTPAPRCASRSSPRWAVSPASWWMIGSLRLKLLSCWRQCCRRARRSTPRGSSRATQGRDAGGRRARACSSGPHQQVALDAELSHKRLVSCSGRHRLRLSFSALTVLGGSGRPPA
jgi:hypothetical protein